MEAGIESDSSTKVQARNIEFRASPKDTKPKAGVKSPKHAEAKHGVKPATDQKTKPEVEPAKGQTSACSPKGKGKSGKSKKLAPTGGKLKGRALLLDLIRRTSDLPKGKPKTGKICGKEAPFNAMNYPDRKQVENKEEKLGMSGKSELLVFGWDSCGANAASWSARDPEYDVTGQLDVEHILEWQTVTGFFDWLDKEYPKEKLCDKILDEGWVPRDPKKTPAKTFSATFESKALTASFNDQISRSFPSIQYHPEEFVLLDNRANTPFKNNMFGSTEAIKPATFKQNPIDYLRQGVAIGLYLQHPKVYSLWGIQALRVAAQFGTMEQSLINTQGWKKTGDGLEAEFEKYAREEWNGAINKLHTFMDKNLSMTKTANKCAMTPTTVICKQLAEIEKTWKTVNQSKLLTLPWIGASKSGATGAAQDVTMGGT